MPQALLVNFSPPNPTPPATSHSLIPLLLPATGSRAPRRIPAVLLHAVLATGVLFAMGSGASIAMEQHGTGLAPAASPAEAAPAARPRCGGCGFVESIRHVEAAGEAPAAYEFKVRMRDGSVRTSSDPSAGRWVVGDRILLVGG